jgi:hypothetical protein
MREEDYREIKKNPQEFTQFIYLSDLLGEAIAPNEVMHEARRLINILYSRNQVKIQLTEMQLVDIGEIECTAHKLNKKLAPIVAAMRDQVFPGGHIQRPEDRRKKYYITKQAKKCDGLDL